MIILTFFPVVMVAVLPVTEVVWVTNIHMSCKQKKTIMIMGNK